MPLRDAIHDNRSLLRSTVRTRHRLSIALQRISASNQRTRSVSILHAKELRQQSRIVEHRFEQVQTLLQAQRVVAQRRHVDASLHQFLRRLLVDEATLAQLSQHIAQSHTALARLLASLVQHLNGSVRLLEAHPRSLCRHTTLLQRSTDGRQLSRASLPRSSHHVHHARHLLARRHRVFQTHAILVHSRRQHLCCRHAVASHELRRSLDVVAHGAQHLRIFAQFWAQLRQQQLVALDRHRSVSTERLSTVTRKALDLLQRLARHASHRTKLMHLAVKTDI